MKNMKRLLSVILVAVISIGLLSGCRATNLESISESIDELKEEVEQIEDTGNTTIRNFFRTFTTEDETPEDTLAPGSAAESGDNITYIANNESSVYSEAVSINDSVTNNVNNISTNVTEVENNTDVTENNIINNIINKIHSTENNITNSGNTTVSVNDTAVDKKSDGTLENLTADERFFVAYQESTITFTVQANGVTGDVQLLWGSSGTVAAQMHDDGVDGDVYADDGIYTAVVTDTISAGTAVFWAQCDAQSSNKVSLYFFAQPTEESAEAAELALSDLREGVQEVEAGYADDNGFVPVGDVEAVMEDVANYLEQKRQSGDVLLYEIEDDSAFVKLPSGLGLVYTPNTEGTDAVGTDVSMTVITCQPCFTDMGGSGFTTSHYTLPSGVNFVLEMLDDAAVDLNNAFDNYSFSAATNYDDSEVTLSQIRAFGSNEIILWHGHGYYGPLVKSCLYTGDAFDWNAYWWDAEYFCDCVSNRIINSDLTGYETVVISSGYIEKYCGNMNNSFVYLAACSSGKHDGLANAFLEKGAAAVVANTGKIERSYNVRMLYETVENMMKIDSETGNYYSLSKALQKAKNECGASDSGYGGIGSKPIIYGGAEAENYRFADASTNGETGTLSGKICQASDRVTPVPGADIAVFQGNTVVRNASADEDGSYTLDLPEGDYRVEISAAGYITFDSYASVASSSNTYLETFLLVAGSPASEGVASGKVYNALTGEGVAGVSLTVRSGWNNSSEGETLATASTDSGGGYSLSLPLGNYTLNTEKEGFIGSMINIVVQEEPTADQNGAISPVISGSEYRIVLTWGLNPTDLDSHIAGTQPNGNSYHVYYRNKSQSYDGVEICNLDVDDTTSYGPETITLNLLDGEPCYYYVHLYTGNGTLATSEAQVKVYQGQEHIATFNVPTSLGSGRYWNVFSIKDGQMYIQNTITTSPDTSYAGSADSAGTALRSAGGPVPEEDLLAPMDEGSLSENTVLSDDGDLLENTEQSDDGALSEDGILSEDEEDEELPEDERERDALRPELQEAYNEVLDRWREAIAEAPEALESEEPDALEEFEQTYDDVNQAILYENEIYSFGFAYTYCDIDGNGTPELLIGSCDITEEPEADPEEDTKVYARVISIYGYDGEQAVELNPDLRGGGRIQVKVYEDGQICVFSSSTAFNGIHELYKIAEDGYSAERKELYEVVSADAGENYYYEGYEYVDMDEYIERYSDKAEFEYNWTALQPDAVG